MTTLADLIAEVAAEHRQLNPPLGGWCLCGELWSKQGCTTREYRLAAALSVENVAAGLLTVFASAVAADEAAALLAAMKVRP